MKIEFPLPNNNSFSMFLQYQVTEEQWESIMELMRLAKDSAVKPKAAQQSPAQEPSK